MDFSKKKNFKNGKKSQATTKRNNENSNITKFPDVFCHVYNKQHDHKLEFFYGELSYEPYNISSNQISHANEDNLRLSKFESSDQSALTSSSASKYYSDKIIPTIITP
ncbi:17815_t:CDS:2 [Entrophospora sp. SA101]|nr:17815_t:CDS:2 [Entrophospora sp. SA101]